MSTKDFSGVLLVALWMCLIGGIATAERTCGSDFDDVGSSALLAPIVAEGRAKRVLYDTGELPGGVEQPFPRISVVFDRLRLYKGRLKESDGNVRAIEVGYFGVRADRDECVAPVPALDRSYVLFLRLNDSRIDGTSTNLSDAEDDARRQRGRGYRLSAFPVRKSRRNIETVVEYTNCSRCGMCGRSMLLFIIESTIIIFYARQHALARRPYMPRQFRPSVRPSVEYKG